MSVADFDFSTDDDTIFDESTVDDSGLKAHPTEAGVNSLEVGPYLTVWAEVFTDMCRALTVYAEAGWKLHTWHWGHQNSYGYVSVGWTAIMERKYTQKPSAGRPKKDGK